VRSAVANLVSELRLGMIQTHNAMAVVPLFTDDIDGPEYLTMGEALQEQLLIVNETSKGGQTSAVSAENMGDWPILLLDGEELQGSKQNRIVNTSVLLRPNSTTSIAVSCSELGRSHYMARQPREFTDSGVVMSAGIRSGKTASVARAYCATGSATADQREIWGQINALHQKTETDSRTSAMRDAFEHRRSDIDGFVDYFAVVPEQNGMIVFVDGEVVGMDILSRPDAFARVAPRLLKSYAMEAVTTGIVNGEEATEELALKFLRDTFAEPRIYPSTGEGYDHRFDSGNVVGSALVVDDTVIHASFFRKRNSEVAERFLGTLTLQELRGENGQMGQQF